MDFTAGESRWVSYFYFVCISKERQNRNLCYPKFFFSKFSVSGRCVYSLSLSDNTLHHRKRKSKGRHLNSNPESSGTGATFNFSYAFSGRTPSIFLVLRSIRPFKELKLAGDVHSFLGQEVALSFNRNPQDWISYTRRNGLYK